MTGQRHYLLHSCQTSFNSCLTDRVSRATQAFYRAFYYYHNSWSVYSPVVSLQCSQQTIMSTIKFELADPTTDVTETPPRSESKKSRVQVFGAFTRSLRANRESQQNLYSALPALSVRDICSTLKRLRCPLFQRRYCWNEGLWFTFWEDLKCTARRFVDDRDAIHFMGRLLFVEDENAEITVDDANPEPNAMADDSDLDVLRGGEFLCVDGQQRMTTVMILLALLRCRLKTTETQRSNNR